MSLNNILMIIGLVFVPTLELRAAIPYGIATLGSEEWLLILIISIIANIILGAVFYYFLDWIIYLVTKIEFLNKIYQKKYLKVQTKIKSKVDKYGLLGVSLFIAVPLPGSGSYTGAIAAKTLGLSNKKFLIANSIGVTIAGIIVTIISLGGLEALKWL